MHNYYFTQFSLLLLHIPRLWSNLKYKKFLYTTKASAVIVENNFKTEKDIKPILIYVQNPYEAFTKILNTLEKQNKKIGISKKSTINKNAQISKGVYIGDFCTIEENVKIE